jgi:hypothetical protein
MKLFPFNQRPQDIDSAFTGRKSALTDYEKRLLNGPFFAPKKKPTRRKLASGSV